MPFLKGERGAASVTQWLRFVGGLLLTYTMSPRPHSRIVTDSIRTSGRRGSNALIANAGCCLNSGLGPVTCTIEIQKHRNFEMTANWRRSRARRVVSQCNIGPSSFLIVVELSIFVELRRILHRLVLTLPVPTSTAKSGLPVCSF